MFVLVPRNKSGHMKNVHYFEEPINFLVLSTDCLCGPSSEFSLALHKNYNRYPQQEKAHSCIQSPNHDHNYEHPNLLEIRQKYLCNPRPYYDH